MSLINLWRTKKAIISKNKAKKKVIKRKYGLPSSQLTLRHTAALWFEPPNHNLWISSFNLPQSHLSRYKLLGPGGEPRLLSSSLLAALSNLKPSTINASPSSSIPPWHNQELLSCFENTLAVGPRCGLTCLNVICTGLLMPPHTFFLYLTTISRQISKSRQ